MNLKYLEQYSNAAIGPVQLDEALFLHALTLLLRPKVVLEIGSYWGDSTRCFLEAGAEHVVAVDVTLTPGLRMLAEMFPDRLTMVECDQVDFTPDKLGHCAADLIFLDASHDLEANKKTFRNLEALIPERGYLLVHDTGLWAKEHMTAEHEKFSQQYGKWELRGFAHQPQEREFVRWVRCYDSNFQRIDFHTMRTLRHGFTLFQRTSVKDWWDK